MFLTDLEPSQIGRIVCFKGSDESQVRLTEMGFKPEQKVRLIRKMAFNGPIQVRVRNCTISMRFEDAASIHIELNE
tara:strand:+ start:318 stop:545 length:228 start_codon:yes stop_codon:yes gene_type:complete